MIAYYITYGILTVATIISYVTLRSYLINTPLVDIMVSNLTLNYVLFYSMLGGLTWYASWKRFKWLAVPITLVVGIGVIYLMSLMGGYKLRW